MLITHEMDVVCAVADRVAVMDSGRVVETDHRELFAHPRAETTRKFVSSVMRTVPQQHDISKLRSEHPAGSCSWTSPTTTGSARRSPTPRGTAWPSRSRSAGSPPQSHTFGMSPRCPSTGPTTPCHGPSRPVGGLTTVQEVSE
ncbi:hypothetical protein QJS66_06775 [Kocuria rhizophila]|nr:hypothetical protein QJS66_06775 [Kocuria rhizophila]